MVGFIQRSSEPSQPGRALDKKNSKMTKFIKVFIIFIITKFGEYFEEILIMFWWKKWKSKSLTNSQDFYPDPPNHEKLKSSVFWMN